MKVFRRLKTKNKQHDHAKAKQTNASPSYNYRHLRHSQSPGGRRSPSSSSLNTDSDYDVATEMVRQTHTRPLKHSTSSKLLLSSPPSRRKHKTATLRKRSKSSYHLLGTHGTEDTSSSDDDEGAEQEEEKYTTTMFSPQRNGSDSNHFLRMNTQSPSHLNVLTSSPPKVMKPKDSDGEITLSTMRMANSSTFALFNASLLFSNNTNGVNGYETVITAAAATSQFRSRRRRLKWMSVFMNNNDRWIAPYYQQLQLQLHNTLYFIVHVLLITVDVVLFFLEMCAKILAEYIMPAAWHSIVHCLCNLSSTLQLVAYAVRDILALNDWTQRDSWKRASALYEESARRHKFFLLTDGDEDDAHEESFAGNTYFSRNTRKLIERQRTARMINTDVGICLICVRRPKEMALMECGHIVSCAKCMKGLKKCPVCRVAIKSAPLRLVP